MRHSGILRAVQLFKTSTCFPNFLLTECLFLCLFILRSTCCHSSEQGFLKYLPREILTDWIIIIKGEPLNFPPSPSNPTYLAEVSSALSTTYLLVIPKSWVLICLQKPNECSPLLCLVTSFRNVILPKPKFHLQPRICSSSWVPDLIVNSNQRLLSGLRTAPPSHTPKYMRWQEVGTSRQKSWLPGLLTASTPTSINTCFTYHLLLFLIVFTFYNLYDFLGDHWLNVCLPLCCTFLKSMNHFYFAHCCIPSA